MNGGSHSAMTCCFVYTKWQRVDIMCRALSPGFVGVWLCHRVGTAARVQVVWWVCDAAPRFLECIGRQCAFGGCLASDAELVAAAAFCCCLVW